MAITPAMKLACPTSPSSRPSWSTSVCVSYSTPPALRYWTGRAVWLHTPVSMMVTGTRSAVLVGALGAGAGGRGGGGVGGRGVVGVGGAGGVEGAGREDRVRAARVGARRQGTAYRPDGRRYVQAGHVVAT